jgi:AcrR family transcriptional regulator
MAQTGRPRSFDRDEAIHQAMLLFWEHGYELTSLALLKAGMGGIAAPSFYAAFGSKEALFIEVIERYFVTHGQATACLWDASLAPQDAIEQALRRVAKMQTDRSHPLGCLLVVSAGTCSANNLHIQKKLTEERAKTRAGFEACVQRAIAAGELPDSVNASVLALMFDTFLVGFSMQTRGGASLSQLNAAITQFMNVWRSFK